MIRKLVLSACIILAIPSASIAANYIVTDLGRLPGDNSAVGVSINSSEQVVGLSFVAGSGAGRAFLGSGGINIDLGTLGGTSSVPNYIHDNGTVVRLF